MWQEGQLKVLGEKWWVPVTESCTMKMENGLGLYEFHVTFVLFVVGIGLTLIFLVVECVVYFAGQRRMKSHVRLIEKCFPLQCLYLSLVLSNAIYAFNVIE